MKYTLLKRRKSVNVKSNSEFVTWMRKNDIEPWHTNEEFMKGYAHRKMTFENIDIAYENPSLFVEALVKNDLLKIEKRMQSFWRFLKK